MLQSLLLLLLASLLVASQPVASRAGALRGHSINDLISSKTRGVAGLELKVRACYAALFMLTPPKERQCLVVLGAWQEGVFGWLGAASCAGN
jgi:hypothetical protein